jgi:uncharacterized protein (DUF849 family)
MAKRKTIITCAVTGGVHTPTMSDALPATSAQIAEQAIEAAEAGAAILHLHARKDEDGRPSIDPEDFHTFLPRIKQSTNAVLNVSTGGSASHTIAERIAPAKSASPEMSSMNMGSINFAFHHLAARYPSFKHDWEKEHVLNSESGIFRNSFADIALAARELGEGHDIRFEHECYDIGHLYNLKFCLDRGMFKQPLFIQFVLGVLGGIGADIPNLAFMKQTADRLFGDSYQWSAFGAGKAQIPIALASAEMGGNIRVGLEDSLFIAPGKLAVSNAEQVHKVRSMLESLGHEIASPDDAREMLKLKGGDRVNF